MPFRNFYVNLNTLGNIKSKEENPVRMMRNLELKAAAL
jgi:hypothetical protein